MPDLRYHLISLISVFLALAIGILLGVAVADQGVVTDRLEGQITDVQRRFEEQQSEIANRDRRIERLQERTTEDEAMIEGMSSTITSGRLIGAEIAIVSGPFSDPDTASSIEDTLTDSGANITFTEQLDPPTLDSEVTTVETTTAVQGSYTDVAAAVTTETGDSTTPAQAVVFVGGGSIPPDSPDGTQQALNEAQSDMLRVWTDAGLRVVGAEPSSSATSGRSEIELFQSAGVTSVDNADTPAGRAAIVELLLSDDDDSYGTKDTASDPFPVPAN